MDPSSGDLAPTGAVRPAVDVTTLDVVGVLTVPPRTTPRAAVNGGRLTVTVRLPRRAVPQHCCSSWPLW